MGYLRNCKHLGPRKTKRLSQFNSGCPNPPNNKLITKLQQGNESAVPMLLGLGRKVLQQVDKLWPRQQLKHQNS